MNSGEILNALKATKVFMFDVDGVFTDNTILINEDGHLMRTMNVLDGLAVKYALHFQFPIHIITGGKSLGVKQRLNALGIQHIHLGIENKLALAKQIIESEKYSINEILYMGDDYPDLEVMSYVGIPVCPAGSHPSIQSTAIHQTQRSGGQGCVREIIELVLQLQGKWPSQPIY